MVARPELKSGDRLVVKMGTASLIGPTLDIDGARLDALVDGIVSARSSGREIVLVSSGAIAAGLEPLGLERRPPDIPSLQAAAAVGQGRLLERYGRAFAAHGVVVAQMLLTRHDFMHRARYLNARNTLERLLGLGAVPIVNENDTVAVDEIAFGDNDRLAALVANLAGARILLLLTDAAGVHAADPRMKPDAPVLREVERITPELERAAGGRGSDLASGGMASKIAAAWVATFSGVGVVVADAREEDIVERVARGEPIGTFFQPHPTRLSARRLWIAFAQPPRGTVTVDDGARRALVADKRSLLAVGVVATRGRFEPGDSVDVADRSGRIFARGLVRFSSTELDDAKGRRAAGREVIHRDQLVILTLDVGASGDDGR